MEFTVESDTWNTLWLIQKTLNEGGKRDIPVTIEIRSGSVESTVSLLADVFTVGGFLLAVVAYIRSRREREKPLRISRASRDAAYAYVMHHVSTEADIARPRLVAERLTLGGYFFEFEDAEGRKHRYTVTNEFDITYSRSRE